MHPIARLPLLLSVSATLAACGEPACTINSFGQFESLSEPKKWSSPESTTGERQSVDMRLLRETHEITAVLNQGFGFNYSLRNLHPDAQLTAVVEHPPIENYKGTVVSGFRSSWSARNKQIAYWFGEEKLLKPGNWTLRIEYKAKVLCEQRFHVRHTTDA